MAVPTADPDIDMILVELLKSFAVGCCASVPIGPVALLVIQKTISRGRKEGWIVGCGCATVDTFWGAVTLLAFSIFDVFLGRYIGPLELLGGLILVFIGISMIKKDLSSFRNGPMRQKAASATRFYFQGLLTALSNPAALFFMVAIMAFWKLDTEVSLPFLLLDIVCIFVGAVSYWFVFSRLASILGSRFSDRVIVWINRIAGIGVLVFSAFLAVRGICSIIA